MAKMGRPTKYSKELAEEICRILSCSSVGVEDMCKANPNLPHKDTLYDWKNKNKEFYDMWQVAKSNQMERLADEMLTIVFDDKNDLLTDIDGRVVQNNVNVTRARLKMEAIKWQATKLASKIFGDKTHVETRVTLTHEEALKEIE